MEEWLTKGGEGGRDGEGKGDAGLDKGGGNCTKGRGEKWCVCGKGRKGKGEKLK